MYEAKINYLVPSKSRTLGDVEKVVNAIGDYQQSTDFRIRQETTMDELASLDVVIALKRTTLTDLPENQLQEQEKQMQEGVEQHFPKDDRTRLAKYFVPTAIAAAALSK